MYDARERGRRCRFWPSAYIFATYEGVSAFKTGGHRRQTQTDVITQAYCGVFRPYLKTSLKLGHGGLENQNVDIENTSCLSMTSSNVSLPVCRICQLPGVEPSNPLISPCRCLGSIRYVHNNCLLVSTYLFHHLVYQNF